MPAPRVQRCRYGRADQRTVYAAPGTNGETLWTQPRAGRQACAGGSETARRPPCPTSNPSRARRTRKLEALREEEQARKDAHYASRMSLASPSNPCLQSLHSLADVSASVVLQRRAPAEAPNTGVVDGVCLECLAAPRAHGRDRLRAQRLGHVYASPGPTLPRGDQDPRPGTCGRRSSGYVRYRPEGN